MPGSVSISLLCLASLTLAVQAIVPSAVEDQDDHIITLRAHDSLTCSVNLDTLTHAGSVLQGQLILDDAGLAYCAYSPGQLTFSFRRDEAAVLVDLGQQLIDGVTTVSDIAPRPPLSVYYSLRLENDKVVYDIPVNRTVRMPSAQAIFGNFPIEGVQHVTPQLGHVYMLRTREPKRQGGKISIVKFLVVEANEQRVVLRIAHM